MSLNLDLFGGQCPPYILSVVQAVQIVEVVKTVQIARQSFLLSKFEIRNSIFCLLLAARCLL